MAKLPDRHRSEDEEDDLVPVLIYLALALASVWLITGAFLGRPLRILTLDAICGIGLLAVLLRADASLNTRLHRLERLRPQTRATPKANRHLPLEFDDKLCDPASISSSSSRADQF